MVKNLNSRCKNLEIANQSAALVFAPIGDKNLDSGVKSEFLESQQHTELVPGRSEEVSPL
jgi:hypothetical protein